MKFSHVLLLSMSAAMQAIATANVESNTKTVSANIDDSVGGSFRRDPHDSPALGVAGTLLQERDNDIEARESKGKGTSAGKGKGAGTGGENGKGSGATAGTKPKDCKGTIKKPIKSTGGKAGGSKGGKKIKRVEQVYTDFLMPKHAQATPTAFVTVGI